jgi:hypothetical protein
MREQQHLSPRIVTRFHKQALEPNDKRVIYDHLKTCDPCRSLIVDREVQTIALRAVIEHLLPSAADEPYHLEYDLIEGYVDNTLNAVDRSITEMHLEVCAECAAEVKDLKNSLRTMRALSTERRPNENPAARINLLFNPRKWFGPPQLALTTGIILLASAVVVIWRLKSQAPSPQPNVVQQATPLPGEPPPLRTTPSPNLSKDRETPANHDEPGRSVDRGKNLEERDVMVALRDGARKLALVRKGTLIGLADLPAETQQQVRTVLLAQTITKPDVISDLRSDNSISRGGDEQTIRPVGPAGVISEDRPLFRWTPRNDAVGYRIVVGDPNFQPIARSGQLTADTTEWKTPIALPRGVVYTWMVTAVRNEQTDSPVSSPPVKFKVLEAERLRELESLTKSSPSHLALGVFYARSGMTEQAKQEFQILLKQNPHSTLAKKLLRQIKEWD